MGPLWSTEDTDRVDPLPACQSHRKGKAGSDERRTTENLDRIQASRAPARDKVTLKTLKQRRDQCDRDPDQCRTIW